MPAAIRRLARRARRGSLLVIAASCALVALPGSAHALTVTQQTAPSCSSTGNRTDWGPTSFQIAKFNPSLGTLTAVTVVDKASMRSDYKLESTDNFSKNITMQFDGSVTLTVPTLAPRTVTLNGAKVVALSAFDGTVDYAGTSGSSGVVGPDEQSGVRTSSDLQAWTGPGFVDAFASATAQTSISASGNYELSRVTRADVEVCVVYTYTEQILVCIGDYIWYDNDKDGIQDAGETGVADRPVRVVDANGNQLGTATSDKNGRWTVCGLEPSTACVAQVDLPDGWNLTAAGQGTDPAVDSNGIAAGTDATIACVTPPRGSDLTFDVGINREPEPAAAPSPPPPSLRASKVANRASVASNGVVKFTVRVVNKGTQAARNLTVCDTPPTQLAFTTRPRGATMRGGQLCWKVATLAGGKAATFTYTMRASNVAARSCVVNRVTAVAGVGGTTSARDGVCVLPTRLGLLQLAG